MESRISAQTSVGPVEAKFDCLHSQGMDRRQTVRGKFSSLPGLGLSLLLVLSVAGCHKTPAQDVTATPADQNAGDPASANMAPVNGNTAYAPTQPAQQAQPAQRVQSAQPARAIHRPARSARPGQQGDRGGSRHQPGYRRVSPPTALREARGRPASRDGGQAMVEGRSLGASSRLSGRGLTLGRPCPVFGFA